KNRLCHQRQTHPLTK
ncbi:hypothetical protein NPIL_486401, partial [Nephila pilipes]